MKEKSWEWWERGGSGKSMSALSIMGLLPDSAQVKSGSIEFCKKDGNIVDLLQLSGQEREKIQGDGDCHGVPRNP